METPEASDGPRRTCPDCEEKLHPIRMVDRGHNTEYNLHYAPADSRKSFWSQRFPFAGIVRGWMCPKCHRILLFGEPGSE